MRALAILLLALVCAGPTSADGQNPHVFACVSPSEDMPPPTWFGGVSDARIFCESNIDFGGTPANQLMEETFVDEAGPGVIGITRSFTLDGDPPAWAYSLVEYICSDPLATYSKNNGECVGGETSLSAEDIAVYVGYIVGAFALGFAMGYLFRVFYKAVDYV